MFETLSLIADFFVFKVCEHSSLENLVVHMSAIRSSVVFSSELDASLSYTTDPAMATKGSRALPAQGGFLLVKPDMEIYDRLCDVIREVSRYVAFT